MSTENKFEVDEDASEDEELLDVLVISTSNIAFQIWKALMITVSFVSSIHYVHIAAFDLDKEADIM